jgi:3-methyladenine DNA glycosylase AlkD
MLLLGMAISGMISTIRNELKQQVDEKTKASFQYFFKEEVKCYGVKSAILIKLAGKYYREVKNQDKKKIFALCEQLLKSDYSEEAFMAFDWAYRLRNYYLPEDFKTFETWVNSYVNNWAKCDTLCNRAIGSFMEKYPDHIEHLKAWTRSPNRWVRRAAAVTLILPARKGRCIDDVFEIADSLLLDKDDLVQKGYGWLLKEASRTHQDKVFSYVMKHKHIMPRTALRYAIEKMPPDLKARAMAK